MTTKPEQSSPSKCVNCGGTISKVTYGAYGSSPKTIWKHVGNRFTAKTCKNPALVKQAGVPTMEKIRQCRDFLVLAECSSTEENALLNIESARKWLE